MKVSVIIPTYNEEKVILDCLESLGKQSLTDFEIIIVDDGSTDTTPQIVERLTKIEKSINLLKQNHKGAGAARNLGVKQAKGEILVFVDADMTFDENFLAKLIAPIVKDNLIGTFSKDEYLANKDNVWAVCWNINRGLPKYKMHPDNYPNTQKVFRAIQKRVFDQADGFDEKAGYTDDWLANKIGSEAVVAKGAVFYHKNPESLEEVFDQSKWMAKRRYKLGTLGSLIGLARVSLPVSIAVGLYKSVINLLPAFLVFKIVSDTAIFLGIMEYTLKGKVSK